MRQTTIIVGFILLIAAIIAVREITAQIRAGSSDSHWRGTHMTKALPLSAFAKRIRNEEEVLARKLPGCTNPCRR